MQLPKNEVVGFVHPDLAGTLSDLATGLLDQGKLAEAEPIFRDALDMYRRLYSGDHPDLAVALFNLAGLRWEQGKPADAYKHQYYSDIFDAQIDILTRAVTSGHTRVATIQAGSADGNPIVPVGPGYPHHNTSHGNQTIFARCQQWYATKFLRLLQQLDVPDPLDPTGKTVLYNSIIVWMSECLPVSHSSKGVPVMLAGNGGGLMKAATMVGIAR